MTRKADISSFSRDRGEGEKSIAKHFRDFRRSELSYFWGCDHFPQMRENLC